MLSTHFHMVNVWLIEFYNIILKQIIFAIKLISHQKSKGSWKLNKSNMKPQLQWMGYRIIVLGNFKSPAGMHPNDKRQWRWQIKGSKQKHFRRNQELRAPIIPWLSGLSTAIWITGVVAILEIKCFMCYHALKNFNYCITERKINTRLLSVN